MTQLVASTGLARAGKDTFTARLVRQGAKRMAFADALKEVVAMIANEPSHLYFDDVTKEEFSESLGMTRRVALQRVGKAMRDALGEDVWVKRALRQWEATGRPLTAISDCRYDNEARLVKEAGGVVVRIVRPGAGLQGEAAQHESERGVSDDLVDVEIHNDGTVSELESEALKVYYVYCMRGAHD